MKTVRFIGGLGNQMFQYAFYKRLKTEFPNEPIFADTHLLETYKLHNGYELNRIFGISLNEINGEDLKKFVYPFKRYKINRIFEKIFPKRNVFEEKSDFIYDTQMFNIKSDGYYIGYWQNYKYFEPVKSEILSEFEFKNPLTNSNSEILQKITETNSVSLHIRRGDYQKLKLYANICDLAYYENAIKHINSIINDPVYFIFSNDIDWCKANIINMLGNNEYYIIDWNKKENSYADMQLMSYCKNNVIANSSFSWWAAYLNKNIQKTVIAPKKWLNRKNIGKIQLDDWILF